MESNFVFTNSFKSDIKVPDFIKSREIQKKDIQLLKEFFELNNIKYFGDLNINILNGFAHSDYNKAIVLNSILGLYGIQFIGKSQKKYSPNSRGKDLFIYSKVSNEELYRTKFFKPQYKNLEAKILDYLDRLEFRSSDHINGINLSVLLDKIQEYDIDIDELSNNLDENYVSTTPTKQVVLTTSPTIEIIEEEPIEICNNKIDKNDSAYIYTTPIEELPLSKRTQSRLLISRIYTLKDLIGEDLKDLSNIKKLGERSSKEIQEFLENLNTNNYEPLIPEVKTRIIDILEESPTEIAKKEDESNAITTDKYIFESNYNIKIPELIESAMHAKLPNGKPLLRENYIDIATQRFGINCDRKTLEEIGEKYNVTRERIRQLEEKLIKNIIEYQNSNLNTINNEIKELFNTLGNIVYAEPIDKNWEPITQKLLSRYKERCFDIDSEYNLIKCIGIEFSDIEKEVLKELSSIGNEFLYEDKLRTIYGQILTKYNFNETEPQKENFKNILDYLCTQFKAKYLIHIDQGIYKLTDSPNSQIKKNTERDEKIVYLFKKLFKEPVHLPIDNEEEVKKNLAPLIEAYPEAKNINTRYLSDRIIKPHNDIIWWDKGSYIHIDNTSVDITAVDFAIQEILNRFKLGISRIRPYAIYKDYSDVFKRANIPNEIALNGLIRYRNHPRIECQRQQIIDKDNYDENFDVLDSLEKFILQFKNGINREDLLEKARLQFGLKPYQIDLHYSKSNKILYDNKVFYHKFNMNINEEKLTELVNLIEKELDDNNYDFLHLRKIRNKYPATWSGIAHKNLSELCMGRIINTNKTKNFIIDNYIYVKKKDLSENSLSQQNILNNFIKEKSIENKYVTYTEITEHLTKQGLVFTKQSIEEDIVQFTFKYDAEAYVHNDVLGYSTSEQEGIFELIEQLAETKTESPLISFEDILIYHSEELPLLNEGYSWNIHLLKSAFSKDERLEIFEKSFIFKENKFNVESIDEVAAYLMLKTFENGYCKLKQLDKLLASAGVTLYKYLHYCNSKLFFEGSSIKLVDDDTAVIVEASAREKYSNV